MYRVRECTHKKKCALRLVEFQWTDTEDLVFKLYTYIAPQIFLRSNDWPSIEKYSR